METLPFIYPISKQPPYRHFSRTTEHAEDRPAKRIKLESSDKVQESAITTLKNANLGGRFGCDCNLSVWSLPLNPSMSQDFSTKENCTSKKHHHIHHGVLKSGVVFEASQDEVEHQRFIVSGDGW